MIEDERKTLYRRAYVAWGVESQLLQLVEECSELVTATCHYLRNRIDDEAIYEEMADVSLMIEQVSLIIQDMGSPEVHTLDIEKYKQTKLERLKELLG